MINTKASVDFVNSKSGNKPEDRFDKLVRYRWLLCSLSVILLIVSCLGLKGLGFDASFRVLFADNNPVLQSYDELDEHFSHFDNLVFVVSSKDQSLLSDKDIESLLALTEGSYSLPFVFQVSSLTNYAYAEPFNTDDILVDDLIERGRYYGPNEIAELKQKIVGDKMLRDRLINSAGSHTLIVADLNIQYDLNDKHAMGSVLEAAQALKSEVLKLNPNIEINLAGTVMNDASTLEVSEADMRNLMPLVLFVGCLITYVIGRSIATIIAALVVMVASVLTSLGICGWFGLELNVMSNMAALLILILALADTIHLGTSFLNALKPGVTKIEAMAISLRHNVRAIFITSLTTAAGFFSLNFIGSDAFSGLGNIAILGVVIAFVFSVTLYPAVLVFLSRQHQSKGFSQERIARTIARVSITYQKPLAWLFLLLALFSIPFITQNEFNHDYRTFYHPKMEMRQATEQLIDGLRTGKQIEYVLNTQSPEGVNDPEFLKQAEAFVDWYSNQEGVTHVYSYVGFLKRLNQIMFNDDPNEYRLPESRTLASQYLLLYEMSASTDVLLSTDKSMMRVIVNIEYVDDKTLLVLEERAQSWLKSQSFEQAANGMSMDMLFAQAGKQITGDLAKVSLITMVLVTIVMMLGLGSLKYGLIGIIPNLIPPLVIYGFWGAFIKDIDQGIAVTYSVALGIIVDDTVHIISKYMQQRKVGELPAQAIVVALENSAVALMNTTLFIGAGLCILGFGDYKPNATIGTIMAPIIFLALFFDLFLLPAILLFFDRRTPSAETCEVQLSQPTA